MGKALEGCNALPDAIEEGGEEAGATYGNVGASVSHPESWQHQTSEYVWNGEVGDVIREEAPDPKKLHRDIPRIHVAQGPRIEPQAKRQPFRRLDVAGSKLE